MVRKSGFRMFLVGIIVCFLFVQIVIAIDEPLRIDDPLHFGDTLIDPSAAYCDALGYQYIITSTPEGDWGFCQFPSGEKIDSWQFFLGDAGQDYNYCSLKGYQTETSTSPDSTIFYLTDHVAMCVLPDTSKVEVAQLMGLQYDSIGFFEDRNNRPIFQPINDITINEGKPIELEFIASDPNNDPLTYSIATPPAGATLNGNIFQWTPDFNQAGIYELPFTVSDGSLESFQIVRITVNDVVQNKPPELNNPGDQTITEGKTLRLNLVATDPDNDPLTYSFNSIKALLGAIISGNTFTWTPGSGSAGTYPVTFKATDTGGLSDEEKINITVKSPITNVPTNVKIVPRTINIGSQGYFLTFATLPEAYKSATIDMKTVTCSGATAVRMVRPKIFPRIAVFVFKTGDLQGVGVSNKVALTLNGELKNKGTTYSFTGSDTVMVINKPTWQPDDIRDVSTVSDDQLFKKYSI